MPLYSRIPIPRITRQGNVNFSFRTCFSGVTTKRCFYSFSNPSSSYSKYRPRDINSISSNSRSSTEVISRKFSFLSQSQSQSPPPEPPLRGYAKLNRDLILVSGPDSPKFLNGLITNHLTGPDDHGAFGFYTGFLNSKGRIIADTFIYPTHYSSLLAGNSGSVGGSSDDSDPAYIIECDPLASSTLLSMLKLYKLRAKVTISLLEPNEFSVWQIWDDSTVTDSFAIDVTNQSILTPYCPNLVGANDSRAPSFGIRLVLREGMTPLDILSQAYISAGEFPECSAEAYHIRRLVYGIPEGTQELPIGSSLPLDSCMDYMGGIDFNKGCYVGQELTIRSHHHGIVRKRVIPVVLLPPKEEANSDKKSDENSDDNEPSLMYDPTSPISTSINSASLAGSLIVDISSTLGDTRRLSRVTNSSSPFGLASTKKSSSSSSTQTSIRPSGTLLYAIGNVGLALVRLEHFSSSTAEFAIATPAGNIRIHGFQPYWWPLEDDVKAV